jgi:hypothetical protein
MQFKFVEIKGLALFKGEAIANIKKQSENIFSIKKTHWSGKAPSYRVDLKCIKIMVLGVSFKSKLILEKSNNFL